MSSATTGTRSAVRCHVSILKPPGGGRADAKLNIPACLLQRKAFRRDFRNRELDDDVRPALDRREILYALRAIQRRRQRLAHIPATAQAKRQNASDRQAHQRIYRLRS